MIHFHRSALNGVMWPFAVAKKSSLLVVGLLLGGCVPLAGAEQGAPAPGHPSSDIMPHALYLTVSMNKGFFIGSKVPQLSGIYRSTDRRQVEHVGYNHIRLDGIAADPHDPDALYVVGLNGASRVADSGRSWRILTGWDLTQPKDIALGPHNSGRVFLALPDGIAASEDRGKTWRRRDRGIERKYTQTIAIDRSHGEVVLAGTELGIYLSSDSGTTWRRVLATDKTVNDIRQSPHAPEVFIAVTQSNGAWRSGNHGKDWAPLGNLPVGRTLHNVDFDTHESSRIAVCGWDVGVQISEDGGGTWLDRSAGLPSRNVMKVFFDPDIPGRIYAAPYHEALYASDDLGKTWRSLWFEGAVVWDFLFVRAK
ncbi:MAG: hypothetical protein QM760_03295 [Nibricoccus sp.]